MTGILLGLRDASGRSLLLGTATVSGGTGQTGSGGTTPPTYATTFSVSASTSMTVGTAYPVTITPSGAWPPNEVVALGLSGLAGTFTNGVGSGTAPVVIQFTPTAAGNGFINASASGMTSAGNVSVSVASPQSNTNGSNTTNPVGNITPGSYSPLTGIDYVQVEPWGQPVASNGDNYKSVTSLFGPIGGTGPFVFSIDNPTFVSWNVTEQISGSRSTGIVKHGWIASPGNYPDNVPSIVLRITDALGASVTKTISSFDKSLQAGISISAIRSWPNNIAPQIPYVVADTQGNINNSPTVTLVDASGLWQAGYGSITPKSGIPPVGSYPVTLSTPGYPDRSITLSITTAQMGGIVITNRAAVVSTASPTGWPVFRAVGSTPFNSPVYTMDDTGGAYMIDAANGQVTVLDPTKLTIGTNYIVVHQAEGALTTSLTVSVPVTQGTTLPASAISFAGVRQSMTNDEHNVALGAPTVTGITGGKWFLGGYTRFNPYAAEQQAKYLTGQASDNGTTAQFVIDQITGQITMPFWVDAGLDGTSSFTYQLSLFCTDGSNTCSTLLPIVVSWAPVSRTVYIGRGMVAAHGADGYEHIADYRSLLVRAGDANPHTGTIHVLIAADADPDYYANDTGTKTSDYYCRFPWPGPIVVEGVAANGLAQPRTGGPSANNAPGGADMRGKGNWTFGNGQAVLKNIEVSCVHGSTPISGIEATRKDGATYGSLSVIGCNIHDCDQGVETGNWIQGSLHIDQTEIASCGTAHASAGASHNIYCGQISFAEIKNSVSRHASVGHCLKVRAMVSKIHDNRFYDGLSGNASSLLNIPDGGDCEVWNNKMSKGVFACVNDALRFGEDLYKDVWLYNNLNFHDNAVDVFTLNGAHWGIPTVVGHLAQTNRNGVKSSVTIANNSVWLAPGALVWADYNVGGNQIASTGQTTETGTTIRSMPQTFDMATRPVLSGALPLVGPLSSYNQWDGDSYSNFNGAQQLQDRDQIVVPASSAIGTTLVTLSATIDTLNAPANPWASGATASLTDKPVFYPYGIVAPPAPWRNDLFSVADVGGGKFALKTAATLSPGVYYAQVRVTATNGALSDARYPVIVTA